jgi:hypothetical protein
MKNALREKWYSIWTITGKDEMGMKTPGSFSARIHSHVQFISLLYNQAGYLPLQTTKRKA